jgi:hypothetical protein
MGARIAGSFRHDGVWLIQQNCPRNFAYLWAGGAARGFTNPPPVNRNSYRLSWKDSIEI